MAKLVAKAATDMTQWESQLTDGSEADVGQHDDEHFVANSDDHTYIGTGENLSYGTLFGHTVPTGGTIHSLKVVDNGGPTLFSITHANFQADDFSQNAATDDWDSIQQEIFRGNDTMVGSIHDDHFLGFDGDDRMRGNDGDDSLRGGTGQDTSTGGAGNDRFVFKEAGESTSTGFDTITDLNAGQDNVVLTFAVSQVEADIDNASVSKKHFDVDLAQETVGLGNHHAVLVNVDGGRYDGHTFLVVDKNGTAGYQAGADFVVDVTGMTGTLTTGSFEQTS